MRRPGASCSSQRSLVTGHLERESAIDRESPESAMDDVRVPTTPGASVLTGGSLRPLYRLLRTASSAGGDGERQTRRALDRIADGGFIPTPTTTGFHCKCMFRTPILAHGHGHNGNVALHPRSRKAEVSPRRTLRGAELDRSAGGRGSEALSVRNGQESQRKRHPALSRNSCAKYIHYPGEGQEANSA